MFVTIVSAIMAVVMGVILFLVWKAFFVSIPPVVREGVVWVGDNEQLYMRCDGERGELNYELSEACGIGREYVGSHIRLTESYTLELGVVEVHPGKACYDFEVID